MTATVVVVGGGYGGVTAAQALDPDADVVLVEPKDAFVHNVAALRATVDMNWADQLFYPYDRLLKRGRVLREWVVSVDPQGVQLATGTRIRADYVVIATGTSYPPPAKVDTIHAAQARTFYHNLTRSLYDARRILLLGAGPVGLELAGEINAQWPDKLVTILEPAADILSRSFVVGFKREAAATLRLELHRQLDALGIEVILGTSLREQIPTPPGQTRTFTATTWSGRNITADIWFQCHGRRPAADIMSASLDYAKRQDGYLTVDDDLRLPGQSNVFAIGDVAATHGIDSAVVAMEQGELVADNIRRLMAGDRRLKPYQPNQPLFLIPLGPKGGVSYSPDGAILDAETTSQFKGSDLFTAKYRETFGLD